MDNRKLKFYPPLEEKLNIISHGLGLFLSILGFIFLLYIASRYDSTLYFVSVSIFGLSLISLYAVSTFYHSIKKAHLRMKLRVVDHAAIYIFIAGTYTPFALITLRGKIGWLVFILSWTLALIGVVLKLFFTGRFVLLSTLTYLFMGWIIVFFIKPLINNLALAGVWWLFAGGIAYSLGAFLYAFNKIKFNHAIFHFFVLLGSIFHYVVVALYVRP